MGWCYHVHALHGPVSDEGIRRVQLTLVTMADIAMAYGRYKKGEMVKKKWGARRKWRGPRNVLVATAVVETWTKRLSSCTIFTLLRKFPLARYAAEHWVDHARFENVSSHVLQGMEDVFDPDKPYFAAWLQVHDIDTEEPRDGSLLFSFLLSTERDQKSANPLYCAALCGFHDMAEELIFKHPQQVNTTGVT